MRTIPTRNNCLSQVRHGYALRPDVHALVESLLHGGVEANHWW